MNFQAAIGLADGYRQLQQPDRAVQTLQKVVDTPGVDPGVVLLVAESFNRLGNFQKLESTLDQLVKIAPEMPEAWYDLAGIKVRVNKTPEAAVALRRALDLSDKRHQKDPKAADLSANVLKDQQFAALRESPEFKKLPPAK